MQEGQEADAGDEYKLAMLQAYFELLIKVEMGDAL